MKRFLSYTPLVVIVATAAMIARGVINPNFTLGWDNQPGVDYFFLYSSTNAAAPQLTSSNTIAWTPVAAIPGTNFTVGVTANLSAQYFILTASNLTGESFPSQSVTIPNVVTNPANFKRVGH